MSAVRFQQRKCAHAPHVHTLHAWGCKTDTLDLLKSLIEYQRKISRLFSSRLVHRVTFLKLAATAWLDMRENIAYDEAHLLSLVSNLGFKNRDGVYVRDLECAESLQDIQRFLRQDQTPERRVAQQLIAWNLISKDLFPIIKDHAHERILILQVLKLLVHVTLPTEVEYCEFKAPSLCTHQNAVINIILDDTDATKVLLALMCDPLQQLQTGALNLDPENLKIVELVFTLIRNVVLGATQPQQQASVNTATREASLLRWFFDCSISDLLIAVAQDVGNGNMRETGFLVVETLRCLCTSTTGTELMSRSHVETQEGSGNATNSNDKSWIRADLSTVTRFSSRYKHSSFSGGHVRDVVTCAPQKVMKSTVKRAGTVFRSKSHTDLSYFLRKVKQGPLPVLMESVFRSLQSTTREAGLVGEGNIRVYNFIQVLTYFLEGSSLALHPDGSSDNAFSCVNFAHIFSTSFVHYLSIMWEKWTVENDTFGLVVLDHFIRVFLQFLTRQIENLDDQIRLASHAIATQILSSKKDSSVLQHALRRLKSSDCKTTSPAQFGLLFENIHRASMLQRKLNLSPSSERTAKLCVNSALLKKLAKCSTHVDTMTDTAVQSTIYCLQLIRRSDPIYLRHADLLLTYSLLSQKHALHQHSGANQAKIWKFMKSNAHQLIRDLRPQDAKGSTFINNLFSPNVHICV